MKRIAVFLLSVLLLGTIAACYQGAALPAEGKIKLDKATIEPGATHSDFEGISIRIINAVWNDDEIKLDVDWNNQTDHDVTYGEPFSVERENNGDWINCQTLDSLGFHAIGYEIKPGITQKKTYSLTDIFDISQNGKYRFKTDCIVYDKGRGGEYTKCELWAEFAVTRIGDTSNDVKNESDAIVLLDGIKPDIRSNTVRESGKFSNITLTIPHGWNYETERKADSGYYCISFWPESQTEGKIKVWYYDIFGVCGTGLTQEKITLGNYEACKGTYDNNKTWDFITFADMPGFYVAMNVGADKWWNEYGDEAMQILSTVKLADGIINKEQAIEIAKKEVTVEYNEINADFDTKKGLWIISFGKENTVGGDQIFYITHEGKITDVKYGGQCKVKMKK